VGGAGVVAEEGTEGEGGRGQERIAKPPQYLLRMLQGRVACIHGKVSCVILQLAIAVTCKKSSNPCSGKQLIYNTTLAMSSLLLSVL
jgi:hypothetical protein